MKKITQKLLYIVVISILYIMLNNVKVQEIC